MIFEDILKNSGAIENIQSFEKLVEEKIRNLEKLEQNLEIIKEAVDVSPNIYKFTGIMHEIDQFVVFNPYENFGGNMIYLIAFKEFETLHNKKQKESLSEKENIAYENALDNVGYICFPAFLKKEDITPEKIRNNPKNLLNRLLHINEKMLEIHNASSIFAIANCWGNQDVDSFSSILKTFKNYNFDNIEAAERSVAESFELMTRKYDYVIEINDADILKHVKNEVISGIDVNEIEDGVSSNIDYRLARFGVVSTLELMRFFIKKAIYITENGNSKNDYFSTNLFNIKLEEREYGNNNQSIIEKLENLLIDNSAIKMKCSSIKTINEEQLKSNLVEAVAEEVKEFVLLLKENRKSHDYMENSISTFDKFVIMAKKENFNFRKEYPNIFSSYQTRSNMKDTFSSSVKTKKYM